jgi:hypothetical protein
MILAKDSATPIELRLGPAEALIAVVIPTLRTVAVSPLADPAVAAVATWAGPCPSAVDWFKVSVAMDASPVPVASTPVELWAKLR